MDPLHTIAVNSQILAHRLTQHSTWGERLCRDPYRTATKPPAVLAKECAAWCASAADVAQGVRWCKYYELARIAWRTWQTGDAIEAILHDWSGVADVLIQHAFRSLATTAHLDSACVLMALGKLGAEELNASSDVDLLMVYDDALMTVTPMTQLAQRLTTLLQQHTADGFVFRVDWDLRPEGDRGPLAQSLGATLHHYETRGTEWERMMLIRARPMAGNLALGHTVCDALRPFIYPRHASPTILDALRELKQRIEHTAPSIPFHVKLGRGGIREIEFVIQALQLLHGGHRATLQQHSTWIALDAIAGQRLLPMAQTKGLREAYRFFRHLENMLQIDGDEQRHQLPQAPEALARLTSRLSRTGADDATPWVQTLTHHQTVVHDIFRRLFTTPYEKRTFLEAVEANRQACTSIEEEIDALSWSKRSAIKAILTDDISRTQPFDVISRRLTFVADVIVDDIRRIAWQQCVAQYGVPCTATGTAIPFAIVALGNCGAVAMDYGSDLDLVFLYGGVGTTTGPTVVSTAEFFARLGQKIIALLTVRHRYGPLYPVDLQLRPSGEFGVLVTTDEAFARYHREPSAVWEHQALLRARVIAGDWAFRDTLSSLLAALPFQRPLHTNIRAEIAAVRRRMEAERAHEDAQHLDLKFGPGGIADIEFLVQAIQLDHGATIRAVRCTNPWDAFTACCAAHLLPATTVSRLADAYSRLRRVLAHYRLLTNAGTTRIDLHGPTFGKLVEVLGFAADAAAAKDEITALRQWIRKEFETYFYSE